MGFSVRVAPGVRVRASSRGLRASVGPRAARVHFGSGRTGFSTGAGPVSYYTSVGRGRPSTGRANQQLTQARLNQADKAAQAEALADALSAIIDIHRTEFPVATRVVYPEPQRPDPAPYVLRRRKLAKKQTRVFDRRARKSALAEAATLGAEDARAAHEAALSEHSQQQAAADAWWDALTRCEPETVLGALATAFEDNEAAAAAVGVEGSEVSLVVLIPPESAVPDRRPTLTQSGNLSLKKLTKSESADFYKLLTCGYVLVTLRETFAVVPSLESARIVAIREGENDAYGRTSVEVLMAGRCAQKALEGVRWEDADAARVFNDCLTERVANQAPRTGALRPVPLDDEPDLAKLVGAIDLSSMTG